MEYKIEETPDGIIRRSWKPTKNDRIMRKSKANRTTQKPALIGKEFKDMKFEIENIRPKPILTIQISGNTITIKIL